MSKSKRMFGRWAAVAALILVSGSQAHAQGTTITIGSATGPAGGTTSFTVSFSSDQAIAGTQNNITFDPKAAIATKPNGKPDCTFNPDIDKGASAVSFQGTTAVKALVLSFDNVCPICGAPTTGCPAPPACPVVMYTCNVTIAADATGSFPLTCSAAQASTPGGQAVPAACTDGMVSVGEVPTPTNTGGVTPPTPTPTPVETTATATATGGGGGSPTATSTTVVTVPTATSTGGTGGTATATATGSRVATATATGSQAATATVTGSRPATATPTGGTQVATPTITGTRQATPTRTGIVPTRRPVRPTDDDACAIVSPATSASGWMLLLPAAALLWIRRRSR
jgi:hypothetical protein